MEMFDLYSGTVEKIVGFIDVFFSYKTLWNSFLKVL